jgi:hypothetical protein
MEIHKITENKDGSCTLECTFTEVEQTILLSYAVTNILRDQIKKME